MDQAKKIKVFKVLINVVMGVLLLVLLLVAGFYVYTLDYYRASPEVNTLLNQTTLEMNEDKNLTIIHPPRDNDLKTGLIFYPGGKVEASAYLPLLMQLSERGLTCVLVEMPLNLAVFNINAAEKVYDKVPSIKNWYLSGHSLGGAMASSYLDEHADQIKGLILMGAYPINDAAVETLVLYGTEDIMLDLSKLATVKNVFEIKGGNHAQFGNYGDQEGDGVAHMSREEQQVIAVDKILDFITSTSK